MNHYYFVATLPQLSLTAAPQWSEAEFVAAAEQQLGAADAAELRAVLAGAGSSAFARRRREFDQRLALLCARLRAERRGLDRSAIEAAVDEGVPDVQLRTAVADAFAAPDPLERQRRLDALTWRWLEGAAQVSQFALDAIFAHGLMLQLAWRWQPRTAAAGDARLAEQRERLLAGFDGLQMTMTEEATA